MVKYLNAECYKVFRRKYPYVFVGVLLFLIAGLQFLLYAENLGGRVTVSDLLNILSMLLSAGLYLLMMAADMVFSEQHKYNTLKNEVSFGLPRIRIYLGKLLSSTLVAVVLCAVLVGGYLGLSLLLFPTGDEFVGHLQIFGLSLLMSLPLWLGGLAFFCMLQFLLKGSTASTIVYIMVIALLGSGFLQLMSLFIPSLEPIADFVRLISLNTPFDLMNQQGPVGPMGYAWTLGMAWFGVSTVVGIIGFQKKEIS